MTAKTSLNRLTATEASAMMAEGWLTAVSLLEACLERIEARDEAVGAWTHLDTEAALAQAQARDDGPRIGPLHGIPVAIKDIIDTHDMPTEYGSPAYAGHQPAGDAACVALLRAAGAVIMGKSVTTEFAAVTPGKTANPHDPEHTPGGSSSGSAAAVADFQAPLALGTQTVGSTIRPAAYCGVVGFKPSYHTFTLAGVMVQAETLDTLGLMARSVDDIRLLSDGLLAGGPVFQAPVRTDPPRLAFCPSPHWPEADGHTRAAMEQARGLFEAAGASVTQLDLPPEYGDVLEAHWTILCFEFARVLAFEKAEKSGDLSAGLLGLIERGMAISVSDYRDAFGLAETCRADIGPRLEAFDAVITPSAASAAPRGLFIPTDRLFQRLWTVLRVPAITLPGFSDDRGLPIGVQLVGPSGADADLLAVASWAESVIGYDYGGPA